MSLKRECDSCHAATTTVAHEGDYPGKWGQVLIKLPGNFNLTYDLCSECCKKPIQFGTVSITPSNCV